MNNWKRDNAIDDPNKFILDGDWENDIIDAESIVEQYRYYKRPRMLIFSGSFNPLHRGHKSMSEIAEKITGLKTNFEISIGNPDKPSLSDEEVKKRKQQFTNYRNVYITNNSLYKDKIKFFLEKAENLFFIMGADTWNRFCVPKYDDVPELNKCFSEIGKKLNFIIFPRNGQIGENMIDKSLINSIVIVNNFDCRISSTEIRNARN